MAQHTVVVEQAPSEEKKKRKKLPLILAGVGILALVPLVGSTFAASITLGTGAVEFGQGTREATACDASIDTALSATVASASFTDTALTLSDIDVSTGKCGDKTFVVRIADYSNNLLTLDGSSGTSCSFVMDDTSASAVAGTGCTVDITVSGSTGTVAVDFAGTVDPTSVSKVLLETIETP
jgi:hypothetical protein